MMWERYQLINAKLVKHLEIWVMTCHVNILIVALANYHRLLMQFGVVLHAIAHYSSIGIIVSFPIPLCVKLRNSVTKIFDGDGNIG